ncbi:MAG: fumarylacetoacetate hydrolase family protein [Holophagaceae bacterium]|uniref:Fumarylacetoacetate hydrolase family protein n=1 Tax=Candidatus Geothrix skivensis TaxID=2954439 RepID=A0A9D7SGQ9_9BACT|nr:fumarylacetoacetate hydrolase family protein [Candidatus Geothrix skivensis]
MESVIPVPTVSLIPVMGSAAVFPVRRIYCVGRNYADHAREMGMDPEREPPFFFGKPQDVVVPGGGPVHYPPATANLHHEVELVVALARGGRDIPVSRALDCVFGYAVGIDLTRRDLQAKAKDKGQPWDTAKGFDESAPISAITPANLLGHPGQGAIWLAVNGVEKQRGDLADMIWSVPEVLAHISGFVALAPGDLIYTGTPAGVGPLVRGDQVRCGIQGLGELAITLV